MLYQLINTMQQLHDSEKFAHRDIKPSNIFLVNNKYKIGDFGVSKVYSVENFG